MQGISSNFNIQRNNFYTISLQKNQLNQNRASFKGHLTQELFVRGTKRTVLIQETAFFRQLEILKFIREYADRMFKDGIRILDGACSTGEETWSLAMLFSNLHKPVKITGFDLGPEAINDAKQGIFRISKATRRFINPDSHYEAYKDSYLAFDEENLSEDQQKCKALFNEFFEPCTGAKEGGSFKQRVKRWIFRNLWINLKTKFYRVKPEKANMCDFVQGDITNLDEIAQNNSVNVLLFRNALYHLLTDINEINTQFRIPKSDNEIIKILGKIVDSAHSKLSKNGLFVLGNNEGLQTFKPELIKKVLRERGFVPILGEDNMYSVPSVWQKVS